MLDRFFLSAEVSPGTILSLDMRLVINGLIHGFTIILVIMLLSYLLYNPVKKFMADRMADISGNADAARLDRKKAEEIRASYQELLDKIDKERDEILKKAHRKADEEHDQILTKAQKAAEDLIAKANSDIDEERAAAAGEIKRQIAEISALIAGRFVETETVIDQETQARFIDEALADWGEKA